MLTMRYTEDNDLWFHVRGASGAHTVLKVIRFQSYKVKSVRNLVMDEEVKDRRMEITKEHIHAAAAIAAYYSKARNAKKVTVAYTLGKYVNKYKGAKSGSVVIRNEKTVKAEPGIPI